MSFPPPPQGSHSKWKLILILCHFYNVDSYIFTIQACSPTECLIEFSGEGNEIQRAYIYNLMLGLKQVLQLGTVMHWPCWSQHCRLQAQHWTAWPSWSSITEREAQSLWDLPKIKENYFKFLDQVLQNKFVIYLSVVMGSKCLIYDRRDMMITTIRFKYKIKFNVICFRSQSWKLSYVNKNRQYTILS